MGMMTLHLVYFEEGFADFVLEVGKVESCLLVGTVTREMLVLVETVVRLVAGTQLSQR